MPPKIPRKSAARQALIEQVSQAGRAWSTVAIMFHAKVSELQGLNPTDVKALDLVARYGPLTAGELAQRSGLSKASVTGLVDRLVNKGFARRTGDPDDGRRVVIEFAPGSQARLMPYFADLIAGLNTVYEQFDDAELRVALRFLEEVSRCQAAAAQRLDKVKVDTSPKD